MKRTPLKRKTPLRAKKSMARKGRVTPVNTARRKAEFARTYGSESRVAFIQQLPCIVSLHGIRNSRCATRRHNAHITTDGMGRKAPFTAIVPLCPYHHRRLDDELGKDGFEQEYHLDLALHAAETEAAWQAHFLGSPKGGF